MVELPWLILPSPVAVQRCGPTGGWVTDSFQEFQPMSEVSRILSAIDAGDPNALERLLPMVYDELRQLAATKLAAGPKPGI